VGFVYCLERCVAAQAASGALEIVLPEWSSDGPPFTIYHPSRRQAAPGPRQFIDIIREAEGLRPVIGVGSDRRRGEYPRTHCGIN